MDGLLLDMRIINLTKTGNRWVVHICTYTSPGCVFHMCIYTSPGCVCYLSTYIGPQWSRETCPCWETVKSLILTNIIGSPRLTHYYVIVSKVLLSCYKVNLLRYVQVNDKGTYAIMCYEFGAFILHQSAQICWLLLCLLNFRCVLSV